MRLQNQVATQADVVSNVANYINLGGWDSLDGLAIVWVALFLCFLVSAKNSQHRTDENDDGADASRDSSGEHLRRVVHELATLTVARRDNRRLCQCTDEHRKGLDKVELTFGQEFAALVN
jgi:hypothetical protein